MNINDPKYFLGEGKFTQRNEFIRKIATDLKRNYGSKEDLLKRISNYIHGVMNDQTHNPITFRKRTASQILQDNYETGCTDRALVFLVLARELGIPARYVETLNEDWIKGNKPPMPVLGHIFTDVFINGSWKVHEPFRGFTEGDKYTLSDRIYIPVGRGLDFSELDTFPEGCQDTNQLIKFRKSSPVV